MRQKLWVLKSHKALVDNETLSHSTLFQLSTDKLCRTGELTHPIFKKKKSIHRLIHNRFEVVALPSVVRNSLTAMK